MRTTMQLLFTILTLAFLALLCWQLILFLKDGINHHRIKNNKNTTGLSEHTEEDVDTLDNRFTRYPSKDEQELVKEQQEEKIVGLAKPVGYWSNRIFQEKLPQLMAKLTQDKSSGGFWQKYVRTGENNKRNTPTTSYRRDRFMQKGQSKGRGR